MHDSLDLVVFRRFQRRLKRAGDGELTQSADGVLGAVRAFVGLLAQAEAAALAAAE